jgi:HSP20 family protein
LSNLNVGVTTVFIHEELIMANHLTRFDPFRNLARFDPLSNLGDLWNNFALSPLSLADEIESMIKLDVTETDKAYIVKAEMPGVNKEDIKVDVSGHQITISSETKKDKEEKSSTTLRCERYYGQQSRSFTLGQEVDESKADAKYENGILMLTLPKKEGGESHKKLIVH